MPLLLLLYSSGRMGPGGVSLWWGGFVWMKRLQTTQRGRLVNCAMGDPLFNVYACVKHRHGTRRPSVVRILWRVWSPAV